MTQSGSGSAATFMGGNVGIGTSTPISALDINGAETLRETATALAPTPAAGKAFLYADMSSHTLKVSLNGSAYADLLTAGAGSYVTSISSPNSDLSVGTGTTPVITLNSGTGCKSNREARWCWSLARRRRIISYRI